MFHKDKTFLYLAIIVKIIHILMSKITLASNTKKAKLDNSTVTTKHSLEFFGHDGSMFSDYLKICIFTPFI